MLRTNGLFGSYPGAAFFAATGVDAALEAGAAIAGGLAANIGGGGKFGGLGAGGRSAAVLSEVAITSRVRSPSSCSIRFAKLATVAAVRICSDGLDRTEGAGLLDVALLFG